MEPSSKVIAIDATARAIFLQLGNFDGVRGDAFESRPMQEALGYITQTLRRIFGHSDEWLNATAPVSRVHLHWTGITLRLRGAMMPGADGRDYFMVLVERGETAEHRLLRTMARWGLSHREAEVLALIGQGKTGPEISILLSISHDTAHKHVFFSTATRFLRDQRASAALNQNASRSKDCLGNSNAESLSLTELC